MENVEIKPDIAAKRLLEIEPTFFRMVNQYCFDNPKQVTFDENSERDTRGLELRLSKKRKNDSAGNVSRCIQGRLSKRL